MAIRVRDSLISVERLERRGLDVESGERKVFNLMSGDMRRLIYGCFLPMLLLLLAGGCSAGGRGAADTVVVADSAGADSISVSDITEDAEAYADSVLSEMSDSDMAGMMYMPAVYARTDRVNLALITEYADELHVGGIVLLKGSVGGAAHIADTLASLCANPGMFIAVDAENGLRMRFADAPEFPWNRDLGKISDDRLLYDFGVEMARECRAAGINMVLGPVMDVVPGDGTHGLMRKRSLGSNPRRVADLAIAYARGLEDGNVISVAKHFPGHGSSTADSHKSLGHIRGSREAIDSIDLYPFRRYAEEGLSGVMVGHLYVMALDSLRRPAVVSDVVMGDVLRGSLGFGGLVITDALNMEGALGVKGWQAIAAGADMVIAPTDTREEIRSTLDAMSRGDLGRDKVRDRCRRILFYKYLLGLNAAPRINVVKASEEINAASAAIMRDSITSVLHRHKNKRSRQ